MRISSLKVIGTLFACAILSPSTAGAQIVVYDQPYRPQVHFSPRMHWTNDPNGLVYFHGEYHLFYQFNPFGDEWGHMSWGHAVSKDLLHWQELPVAIPESAGEMVFTGSIVVDRKNTSGLCIPGTECLIAVYTGHRSTADGTRQTQNVAFSHDQGRTWTRYSANPVLDLHMADFRDPSVSWDEREGHWLMAVSLPMQHKIRFYSSPNLKQWTELSDFGPAGDVDGAWECPDVLRIPGENGKGEMWALKVGLNPGAPQGGSGEQYFLGNFDGKRFTPSNEPGSHGWTNYGKDDYCAISFNGLVEIAKQLREKAAVPGADPVVLEQAELWTRAATKWQHQSNCARNTSRTTNEPQAYHLQGNSIPCLPGLSFLKLVLIVLLVSRVAKRRAS